MTAAADRGAGDAGPNPRQDATDAGHPAPDPAEAKGWRLRLYWPALDRSFTGRVFDYDPRKKTYTVRWNEAAENDGGMTEVDLSQGEVTWLSPPEPGWDAAPSAIIADGDGDKRARSHSPSANETLEEVEKRIGVGTIKWICFQVLKEAGPHGLLLSEIVSKTQEKGLKDWTSVRQPSNTVNACCSGDPAFVKVAPARVGLACLGAFESKEIADEEEKAAGEKILYCSACDNGPFNTKGMRMHISRWCTFAAGKPTANPDIVPTAVADPERSTRDTNLRITAHLVPSDTPHLNHKGSLDDPNHKAAVKTFVCSACGAGPFNEKGMAMHASRWCKVQNALDEDDADYAAAIGGALGRQQPTTSPTSYLGGSVGLTGLAPVGMPGVSIGALSGGLPADLGGLLPQLSNGGAHSGHITGSGSGSGGKKRKAAVDLGPVDPTMFDKHLPAFPVGFAAVAGASGLAGGRGQMLPPPPVFGRRVGKSGKGNKDEAHGETTELRLEVEVWKQDGSFVAKAPLVVPANVTLGKLKMAIADNTKGALPPHRQALKYLGVPLSAPDDVGLVGLLGVTDNISLHLTILEDTMAPPKGAGMPGSPARKAFMKNLAM